MWLFLCSLVEVVTRCARLQCTTLMRIWIRRQDFWLLQAILCELSIACLSNADAIASEFGESSDEFLCKLEGYIQSGQHTSYHSPNRVSAWYTTYFHCSASLGCTKTWDRVWWGLKHVQIRRGVKTRLIDSERFWMFGIKTVVFGGSVLGSVPDFGW